MIPGHAIFEGTAEYAARFSRYPHFYREAQQLQVSSLGIGSYLGAMTDEADAAYTDAMLAALDNGINFIDTSLNYRHQRSELSIGAALKQTTLPRESYVVCTKAGYLVPDAVPLGVLQASDVVGNMHSLAPVFLEDQLERSRQNLGLDTIDVFYLHNPETQLRFVAPDVFYERMRAAFLACEAMADAGKIRWYGTATWDGYRKNGQSHGLSLTRLEEIAVTVGGPRHRFRFIQLPFNLGMTEAYGQRSEQAGEERRNVLDTAAALGITAVASASLLQARLASDLPESLHQLIGGFGNDAARALQFARSAPNVTVALVGMGRREHVLSNLEVAAALPMPVDSFERLFG